MKTTKSAQNYIVELDEIEWYPLKPEDRDALLAGWRAMAESQNCTSVTVFVNPDPLLPIHGIDRRTRVHAEKLTGDAAYETTLTYHAELAPAKWDAMEEKERKVVLTEIREHFAKRGHRNPGRFEIFVVRNGVKEYVERGRV